MRCISRINTLKHQKALGIIVPNLLQIYRHPNLRSTVSLAGSITSGIGSSFCSTSLSAISPSLCCCLISDCICFCRAFTCVFALSASHCARFLQNVTTQLSKKHHISSRPFQNAPALIRGQRAVLQHFHRHQQFVHLSRIRLAIEFRFDRIEHLAHILRIAQLVQGRTLFK